LREAALELDVIAHAALALHLAATTCPPAGTSATGPADVTFDAAHVAVMGHDLGAAIAQLAATQEPVFRAIVLSGTGGSWLNTMLFKRKPTALLPVVELLVHQNPIAAGDPIATILQWALEPADPQIYAAVTSGRQVLDIEGVVDDYALPRIANATSLALRLDLAGTELDNGADPRLADQLALGPLLPLVGRAVVGLPAPSPAVVQYAEDGIEDGHEVLFQVDGPKHAYQCFLASWLATGSAMVPVAAARDAPCP
jgi:pimeloyl-ACP methyl ester carboxylesterase